MNKPPNKCLFCGMTGNMTRQHVFPDRLRHVLPRIASVRLNAQVHRTTTDGKTKSHQKRRTSQGSTQTHRIRRVCANCNSGWMKNLEEAAFPTTERLIRGECWQLSADDRAHLVRLALNIALVGEHLEANCVTTSQQEREHFRNTQTPPHKWFVFMGRDGTNSANPRFLTDGLTLSGEIDVNAPKGYTSFTMTMGHLLLHVLSMGDDFGVDPFGYGHACGLATLWPEAPDKTSISVLALPVFGEEEITKMRRIAGESLRPYLA
jgi:hypothetical protein